MRIVEHNASSASSSDEAFLSNFIDLDKCDTIASIDDSDQYASLLVGGSSVDSNTDVYTEPRIDLISNESDDEMPELISLNCQDNQTIAHQTENLTSTDRQHTDDQRSEAAVPALTFVGPVTRSRTSANFATIVSAFSASVFEIPTHYFQAVTSSYGREWKAAMLEEMVALKRNKVWKLVEQPSNYDRKPLQSMWVYRVKNGPDGNIDRYKARLVVKGCSQIEGIDFDKTFAPVARHETIRMFISVAAQKGFILKQFDIKTAFLHGKISETIYMRQPDGFDDGTGRVCLLLKSLYGLKQAPRAWNEVFTSFLSKYGLVQSKSDPCLFVGDDINLVIYVDDGLIAARSVGAAEEFLNSLKDRFEATIKNADFFLGYQIDYDIDNRSVKLHQTSYINSLFLRFGMDDCNPSLTPAYPNTVLTPSEICSDYPFRKIIGALMYIAVGTRLDIAFAVNRLSQFLDAHSEVHWKMAKRILRYLKATPNIGIKYSTTDSNQNILSLYSDADFANCVTTRKSVSGGIALLNGGPIAWLSRKQSIVSTSTTEAEYVAAHDIVKEGLWLIGLLKDLNCTQDKPVVLYCDNSAAVSLISGDADPRRTKHIDVKFHFVKEASRNRVIKIVRIPTAEQLADILTKFLSRPIFESLRDKLNLS